MRLITLLLLCFFSTSLLAQSPLEATQKIDNLSNELVELKGATPTAYFQDKLWCYLQFSRVPEESEKAALAAAGVNLYQYQPRLIWFASMPSNVSPVLLEQVGVTKVFKKPTHLKADQRIWNNQIPAYAKSGNTTTATIVTAAAEDIAPFKESITAMGIELVGEFAPLGLLEVRIPSTALKIVTELPFVVYLELPEPPAELEFEDEISLGRGAFINGYYNLDGLTGAGVEIAVNEGGIVDTVQDPNFKNRLDRTLEAVNGTVSGHKTGVGLRMASAGNINPIFRGEAWGADLSSGGINFTTAAQNSVTIVNNSFGYGCIPAGPTYNTGAATNDFLVRTYSRFMITYSCGNIGASSCSNYGAGTGWGNITGLVKSAKNIFAVGSMNTDDQLTGFSSRGPAMDGRILPDITAAGPGGTSHASPNLAGVNALLTEAYRIENGNVWPNSGLIKAIILNTADDIENPGPDYKTGFGRINALRAAELIANNQHLTSNVANAGVNTHAITVPAGVSQLKINVYWNDQEATPGMTGKTLVNDLDMRVQQPGGAWVLPWVLNPFPHPDSLNLFAFHGVDTLNNVEQVTINNPAAGTYTAEVTGTLVPVGPQPYFVVHSFVYDSLKVIYPHGGEGLVAGENRRIRWDAFDTGTSFDLEYSIDSGANWTIITTGLASNLRSYNWTIPAVVSGKCLVKVKAGLQETTSTSTFTILDPPANLNVVWRCADSAIISWDSVPGALAYRIYKLGPQYMDTVSSTTNTYSFVHNLSGIETEWVSVQTILPDSGSSRRAIAISIPPGNSNCFPNDLALNELLNLSTGHYPSCALNDSMELKLRLKNTGGSTINYLPIAYQLNGGTIVNDTVFTALPVPMQDDFTYPLNVLIPTGTTILKVWTTYPGDGNPLNDTLYSTITGYAGTAATMPYTQNFDSFINCSTAWGCASITCNLAQGWYNVPNIAGADSIDWRTHNGSTGSGGTGPSGDHTTGSGKYLYLEGSGNGGSGCLNKEALGHTPCLDLFGTNQPTLSYWYHAFGGGIGSLHVDVLSEGLWHLDVGPAVVGAQGNQWLQQQVSLNDFAGENIVVRFRGRTGGGFASDLAIDDINLSTLPLTSFTASNDTICLGEFLTLQNSTTYASNYQWSITPNTFNYFGGNSTSTNPSILPTDTGWYSVQLIATSATGVDTTFAPQLFYVGDFNQVTLTSNGTNDVFCAGDSVVLTASGMGNTFNFYQNSTLLQSGTSPTWTPTNFANGDQFHVENIISSSCSYISPTLTGSIQPTLDGSPIWADDSDLIICAGDTVNIQTVSNLDNYDLWINGAAVQSGPDSVYQTNTLADGDTVFWVLQDSIGCTGLSDNLIWQVNPTPLTPIISSFGFPQDSLIASVVSSSYSWWFNQQLLPFMTQVIPGQGVGTYEVQVADLGCTSDVSAPFSFTVSIVDPDVIQNIQIYPNPARSMVHIILDQPNFDQFMLFSTEGRLVAQQNLTTGDNTLNVEKLAAGSYILKLMGSQHTVHTMLIVE